MSSNHWSYDQELRNVGGILGLSPDGDSSAWHHGEMSKVSIVLGVDQSYDWWYLMRKKFKPLLEDSELLVNSSIPAERKIGTTKVKVASTSDKFQFLSDRVNFGGTKLTNFENKMVELSMGIPGLGFPQAHYFSVTRELYSFDESIVCPSNNGGSCYSHLECVDLYPSFESAFLDLHFLGTS